MRFDNFLFAFTIFTTAAAGAISGPQNVVRIDSGPRPEGQDLFKRKGGGGRGGRGGGSTSSGGGTASGGGSSGSSGSSSPGRAPPSPAGSGNRAPASNQGGLSPGGSGPRPTFGGGRFYGGGATTPYRAGSPSPVGGILPFAILGGAALAFWPGFWLAGAYLYPYHHPFTFHNDTSNKNETLNVLCGCAVNEECGCDDNNSTAYYDSLVGNGSYSALNKSVVNVAMVNGTNTLLINGTLPNGTTADDPNASSSGADMRAAVEVLGFWPVAAAVLATVFVA